MVSIPSNGVDLDTANHLLKVVRATLNHWQHGKAGWPDEVLDEKLRKMAILAEEIAATSHRMARRPRPNENSKLHPKVD